jgi:hypothetical protein
MKPEYIIAEFAITMIHKDQRPGLVVGGVNVQPTVIIDVRNTKIVKIHG